MITTLLCIDPFTVMIYLLIQGMTAGASLVIGVGFVAAFTKLIREVMSHR